MKDLYLPKAGRTPNALFNKAESFADIMNAGAYLASLPPSDFWRIADEAFILAVLSFVYESYPPEERDMIKVQKLMLMELEDGDAGESKLCSLMKDRLRFTKEHSRPEERSAYYYRNFNANPKAMKRAIAEANIHRFGFRTSATETITFI